MEMKELIELKGSQFELDQKILDGIKKPFLPMVNTFLEYLPGINKVLKGKEVTDERVKEAKMIKQKLVKIRTSTKAIHKVEKASALQIGNAVQKCHNVVIEVVSEQEVKLEKIIKHHENLEIERIKELRLERISLLSPFNVENSDQLPLGEMDQAVFNAFLKNAEVEHKKKIAEAQAEEERKQKEKEANEKMKLENEQLKKEAEKEKARVAEMAAELEKEKVRSIPVRTARPVSNDVQSADPKRAEQEKRYLAFKKTLEGQYDRTFTDEEAGTVTFYKEVGVFKI